MATDIARLNAARAQLDKETAQKANGDDDGTAGRPSVATQIVDLVKANSTELCHDEDGAAYVRYGDSHLETWPLESRTTREWMARLYYKVHQSAPRSQALTDAIATLSGIARYDGKRHAIYLRSAYVGGVVIHDLGGDCWRAVRITSSGWAVESSPIIFRRPTASRAIPEPVGGGSISDLIDLLDLITTDAHHVIVWTVAAIMNDGPIPVLELSGTAGSGKTTLLRRIRSMIDPCEADARSAPRSVEDLYVAAKHSHLVAADNVSHVPADVSDALCVICTGGGYARRTLYTTEEETVLKARRPVIVTGVTPVITASDLLDRAIAITLLARADQNRATEAELDRQWREALPRTMGALYDLISQVLRARPAVRLSSPPRMADYAVIGETVSRICGWRSYAEVYRDHRRTLADRGVDSSPVALALLEMMGSVVEFNGTVGQLATRLYDYRTDADAWPRSAKGVADAIRRAAPGLMSAGLAIQWDTQRKMDGFHVRITKTMNV
jgi:hypothetical protein